MKKKLKTFYVFTLQILFIVLAISPVSAANLENTMYSSNEPRRTVQGIVEDNNTALGYITLYNEDGSGTDWYNGQGNALRTFYYNDSLNIRVYKNHKRARMADVEAGNSVFIRLGEGGKVISVSAMDNYTVKYGIVISKKLQTLLVEFDNNEQMVLDINSDVMVSSEGELVEYSELRDGDMVKLTLHITNSFTKLKYIVIEGDEQNITGIYKGTLASINGTSDKIVLQNLQELIRGQWMKTEQKLFTSINVAENCTIYADGISIDLELVNRYLKGKEVYIVASDDYAKQKEAVAITVRNNYDLEANYEDSIGMSSPRTNSFTLFNSNRDIKLSPGSIIIKDNKLVKSSSIIREDRAYVVSNRSYADGAYYAGIVQIGQKASINGLDLYRGRIKAIDAGRSFTVESFSRLKGLEWEYINTPKTFNISAATRILSEDGILNARDFIGYGENSFIGDTIYILASEAGATLISTAPYGMQNVTGKIYEVLGANIGEDGEVLKQPTSFKIMDPKKYDNATFRWSSADINEVNILKNSIILKNNRTVSPFELKKGDTLRVLCGSIAAKANGYIIIVE